MRVNPGGTHSLGAAIDGTTVVYDEDSRRAHDADLKFFDVGLRESHRAARRRQHRQL